VFASKKPVSEPSVLQILNYEGYDGGGDGCKCPSKYIQCPGQIYGTGKI
jgi:hypothetical protein